MVLLRGNIPQAVLTGSANLSEGALFGQLNNTHIFNDIEIAQIYFTYWQQLSQNPSKTEIESFCTKEYVTTNNNIFVHFSPLL
jgi:phosphatidylserine/phosphatidylglycerophosphate/cardiolipin synthase-like enzyme